MSSSFVLPRAHTVRAQWAALNFFPVPGSKDRMTIAVIAVGPDASTFVAEADGISRLSCLFDDESSKYINFVRSAVASLRQSSRHDLSRLIQNEVTFGGSITLSDFQEGSGDSLEDIAKSWLSQVSMLGRFDDHLSVVSSALVVKDESTERNKRIMPAVREEMATMSPFLVANFGSLFRPSGKSLPVKLGYKGNHIVADFSRLSAVNINTSLERVRGKLWTLSEHRDQTAHEVHRDHEMLVIRKASYADDQSSREISILDRACDDLLEEADRRSIRFRQLSSPREAAQRLFQAEMLRRDQIY